MYYDTISRSNWWIQFFGQKFEGKIPEKKTRQKAQRRGKGKLTKLLATINSGLTYGTHPRHEKSDGPTEDKSALPTLEQKTQ